MASQGPRNARLRTWTRDLHCLGKTRFAQQFVNFPELFRMNHE